MPDNDTLIKMSLYVALVLILPGPTNTLLLSSGLRVGLRGTWRLVIAEALGYIVAIAVWGFFLNALAASRPWLFDAVRFASAAYILGLAVKMWATSRALQERPVALVTFRDLFVTTVLNPKALLFASTLFPVEAFQSARYFVWTIAAFLTVLVPIGIGWSCLGRLLMWKRSCAAHTPTLLRGASLVLLTFSGTLMYSIVHR
ncbi:Lysine exporter protein (LYSE/YGGA) [Burkholderia multivorans]